MKKKIMSCINIFKNKLNPPIEIEKEQIVVQKNEDLYGNRSYAQCGEDILISNALYAIGVKNPTYIDIGANHPWKLSNTAYFYRVGFRGINIEPNPNLIAAFNVERHADINLNIGISKESGNLNFYIMNDDTLSTFSKTDAENFVSHGFAITDIKKIETLSIRDVIDKYSNGVFPDLLNIDVEGFEKEILEGIDFKLNYPKIICVETADYSPNGKGKKRVELMNLIESNGYYLYADTNLNSIYVKNESWFV